MSKVMDLAGRPGRALDSLGEQMRFYVRSLAWSPRTLRRYKKEVIRLLAEVSLGSGALSVIGGTVGVIAFLAFFTGSQVGLQGYSSLNQLGTGAFTGFVSAYLNTREIAPLVAGLALAATVGCGFTALAQLADLWTSEIKALIFGFIAAVVASYKGLTAGGGPKGVGDAVNQSVVITFMFLFVVNFVASAVYFQVVPQKI